jgi:hypothetical protein
LLQSCIGMLGVLTWFVAVMYRYARSIDLVSWQSCIGMLDFRPGLLLSCIGMLGVSTW